MKSKQIGTILSIVGVVLIVLSTSCLFLAFFNWRENDYMIAMTESMEPTFYEGDVVKVKLGVNADEIYAAPKDSTPAGDIIAFHKPSRFNDIIVHRAIDNKTVGNTLYFETKGDANLGSDGWIPEQNVVGKVVEINPPFWTYNYIFLGFILGSGLVCIVIGVILRQREPKKVGVVEEKPTTVVKPEPEKKIQEVKKVYCISCGEELPSHAVYCRKCGKKVE